MASLDTLADIDTEKALIGACLITERAIDQASPIVTRSDFVLLRHREIWDAIQEQYATGNTVDVVTIAARMPAADAITYLHELMVHTPSTSNAAQYAETLAGWSLKRDMVHASGRIADLAYGRATSTDPADAAEQARELLANIDMPAGKGAPDKDVATFSAGVDMTHSWLVPDFLERRDRMLVTATEGAGKSVLLTQIAFQVAAGIHPWTLQRITPANVLIVDLENSERLVNRRVNLLQKVPDLGNFNPQRLRINVRPGGIDLSNRTDRRWLMDRCIANATDLLVIGPLYRMQSGTAAKGDVGGEDQARNVTKALDDIRNKCDVTLLMETHAPHGGAGFGRDLRPFGSSVWMRWPEFGIGLRRESPDDKNRYLLEHWRGPRDERTWPEELHKRSGRWPWMPVGMPTGTFNGRRAA